MPSLAQTLQANKNKTLTRDANGNLVEGSQQGLQDLAQQQGLAAPPTTPLGAGLIGANPDQQKMMGTPAQKNAAITLASNPQQNLQTAVREGQIRTQATGAEQQGFQKSQAMKDLGQMGDRVNDFINSQRANLEAAAPATGGQGVAVGAASEFNGQAVTTDTQSLLAQLRADPTNQDLMLKVNQALGYDANTQLAPAQVDQLYQDATSAIAGGGAGVVANNLTAQDLVNNPQFGYDLPTLSSLLGVPQDQLVGMSVSQIHDQVSKVMTDEFSKSQALSQKAQSGELGQAERGAAQQLGKEASATGVRASEADVAHLEQQISNADQVQFNGKAYKVDDLLKDDTISGIISDYMNSGPDSQTRADLDKNEPALSDFIKKNQAVLADASSQLQQGAQTFQDTQAYNKGLSNIGGMQLSDDLAKAVIPGWGELHASKITPEAVPLLDMASGMNPDQQKAMVTAINTQASKDPTFGTQLGSLNEKELNGLQIGVPGGNFEKYINTKDNNTKIQSLQPADTAGIYKAAFGQYMSPPQIAAMYTKAKAVDTLGFGNLDTSVLDPQHTGQIDTASVLNYLKNNSTVPSLKDAAAGNMSSPNNLSLASPQLDDMQNRITNKLQSVASGGYLNYDSLHSLSPEKQLSSDEASYLYQKALGGGVKADLGALKHYKNDLATQSTNDMLGQLDSQYDSSNQGTQSKIHDLANKLYNDPNSYKLNDEIATSKLNDLRKKQLSSRGGLLVETMFPQMSGISDRDLTQKLRDRGINFYNTAAQVYGDSTRALEAANAVPTQGTTDQKLDAIANYLKANWKH